MAYSVDKFAHHQNLRGKLTMGKNRPPCPLTDTDGDSHALVKKVRKTLRQHDYATVEDFDINLAILESEGGGTEDLILLISRYVKIV